MAATITFVRHGNTDANVERWLQGQTGKKTAMVLVEFPFQT